MKKIILIVMLCIGYFSSMAQINVSTGIDNTPSHNAITLGTQDSKWTANAVPAYALEFNGSTSVNYYSPYWQPTPVTLTNAQWIGPAKDIFNNTPGNYLFERKFTIPANTSSFACNFSVAWDDDLVPIGSNTIQLIGPGNSPVITIPVTRSTTPTAYYLSAAITNVVANPTAGVWRIRATVNYFDNVGGFLVSGTITPIACKENVSTGIDNNWVLAAGSPAGPATYVVPAYTPYWQPTPIFGTNAQWINASPTVSNDIPGNYIYERSFTSNGTFATDFALAYDDDLVSLELVRPGGSVISLTSMVVRSVTPTVYYLSNTISKIICNDTPGVWKIRATINYYDVLGGFLLSGNINNCPCDTSCKVSLSVGGLTGSPFACGSTLNLKCATSYDFNPQLTNCSSNCSVIISATVKDATGKVPSWAKNFVTNHGSGGLSIPNNISGTFTLTYNYGINGVACGTCSYTIVIGCLDCKCKKDIVRNYPLINIPTFPSSSNISTTPSTNWFATSNSPQYYTSVPGDSGACDSGFVSMWGNQVVGEQITQTGLAIIAGHQYQIKFAGKFAGATQTNFVRFRFSANTVTGSYGVLVGTNTNMGISANIYSTTNYATFTLPVWTAPANFSVVNINPENDFTVNDGNYVSWGRIDNVCITDVTPGVAESGTDISNATITETKVVKVSASPNPFNNSFRISGLQNKAASMDIVNMLGTTVGHYKTITEGNSFGEKLKAGTYLLRITFNDGTTQTVKLIKN